MKWFLFPHYRNIFLFLILGVFTLPLTALSLEEIWVSVKEAKEYYSLSDKSPKRFELSLGDDRPQYLTKEVTNHEIFSFCQRFLEKYHGNFAVPKLRSDIRYSLNDAYGDITLQILSGKNIFSCFSKLAEDQPYIRIDFQIDKKNLKPFRWDYFDKTGNLFFSEEDESRNGKKDSFTRFESKACPKEITKDRNGIGGIDEWWHYDKCYLSKIEYDENENGYKERTCHFDFGKPKYCEGIGEKEESDAKLALQSGNLDLASALYKRALEELKKEFAKPSSRSCSLLKDIASIDYQRKDYSSFAHSLDEFLNISICETSSLEILVYKGYYQLYISANYKEAKKTYKEAAKIYFREKGEENPELVLNLAYSQFQDKDPLSCLTSLERLGEKRLPDSARFYFYYYRASCNLSAGKDGLAISDLRKSREIGTEKEYYAVILFKLALSHYRLQKKSEGKVFLEQCFSFDPEMIPLAEKESAFSEYFLSPEGQKIKIKYYLNREQK
ncbi:hypothetical protein LPTSP3_g16320 [Leptospira kobayashii]|uniref:Tetratricopeptide repeat protein n=1 Tax=Leptospira kobayashii TaxID=1917830 RepID=A0ABM7UJ50_9LEPT|nr:hypothetical protein [Leptospira kobayashii]BDA78702.1 hypothetical protein LPTSP3_g16320 [Leptospira kobayashii]